MKILKISFLLVLCICRLSAQNKKQYVKETIRDVLETVDSNQQLNELKSIYYQGRTFTNDTSKIEFFKLLPHSFKSHTYNNTDSIASIVNERGYYQYRNGHSFKTKRFGQDKDTFFDLGKFDIYYALATTVNSTEIEFLEENDSTIIFNYALKRHQIYKIEIDKNRKIILKYSCNCLKINSQKGYVKLKDYKLFDDLLFPTREEFWTEYKMEEVFQYDSISVNDLTRKDFKIPEE